MARQKLKTFRGPRWSPFNFFYLALSQLMTCLFFSLAKNLLKEPNFGSDITLSINTHLTAVSIPLFLFLGIFGLKYSLKFYDSFKKNILVCTLISAVFYFAIFYIWALWPYLSFIVLQSVFFLLKFSRLDRTTTHNHRSRFCGKDRAGLFRYRLDISFQFTLYHDRNHRLEKIQPQKNISHFRARPRRSFPCKYIKSIFVGTYRGTHFRRFIGEIIPHLFGDGIFRYLLRSFLESILLASQNQTDRKPAFLSASRCSGR